MAFTEGLVPVWALISRLTSRQVVWTHGQAFVPDVDYVCSIVYHCANPRDMEGTLLIKGLSERFIMTLHYVVRNKESGVETVYRLHLGEVRL